MTLVVVEQNVPFALKLARTVGVLTSGRVAAVEHPERLRDRRVLTDIYFGRGTQPPAPASYAEAEWASERYLGFTEHSTPSCFVCGPAREWGDGLAIYPGPIPGRRLVAAPWAPDPILFDRRGTVRAEFVWAALDCPTGFALLEAFGRHKVTLSQLTVSVIQPLPVGERFVVMGWPFAAEGRTLLGASAIFSEGGEMHALGSAVLVCAD